MDQFPNFFTHLQLMKWCCKPTNVVPFHTERRQTGNQVRKEPTAGLLAVRSDRFSPVLIDAMVAAQTSPAQDALMEILDFREENDITLPERYLLAAAFSTHPSYKLLHDLLVSSLSAFWGSAKPNILTSTFTFSCAEPPWCVLFARRCKSGVRR